MTTTAVRRRAGIKHPKPRVVTAYESIRVLLDQQDGKPLSLGTDWEVIAVPSSGSPDSPPFYFVKHNERLNLWLCHCKQFRYRGTATVDCDHIKEARHG